MSSPPTSNVPAKSIDESLIDLIRVNPLLFEKGRRIKPYESMKERSELWKSIATSLGLEPNCCIARWKHLRDRYRREIANRQSHDKQSKQAPTGDNDWPLMEKMRFLDRYHHDHHHHSHKLPERSQQSSSGATTSNASVAQEIFGGVNYDEPLQEAMDEQPYMFGEAAKRNIALATSTQSDSLIATTSNTNPVLVRLGGLLGLLGQKNRNIAEKRILAYLCKCQLKDLEGESIEDVQL